MAEARETEDPDKVKAQSFIECELCSNTVILHCSICRINLCGQCVGFHINSNLLNQHNIVSYRQKTSLPVFPECTIHENEKCDLYCTQCCVPICLTCITLEHRAHSAIKLEVQCNSKKEQIKNECEVFENTLCKNLEESFTEIQQKTADLERNYDDILKEILEYKRKWYAEVDKVVNRLSQDVTVRKVQDIAVLEKHKEENRGLLRALKANLEQMNKSAISMNLKEILDYKLRDVKDLQNSFQLRLTRPHVNFGIVHVGSFGSFKSKIPLNVKAMDKTKEKLRSLCSRVVLCKSLETKIDNISNLTCSKNDTVWVNGENGTMLCLNASGAEIERTETDSGLRPINLSITKDGRLVFAVYSSRGSCVCKVTESGIDKIITFSDWKPVGMCCTASGDFLVSLESKDETKIKIARYSLSCITQEIQYDQKGQPLYAAGKYYVLVEENKNLDVCASDPNKNEIVVTNKTGNLRWRYHGNLQSGKFHTFSPSFICSNKYCQLLVMDTDNSCVHLLDMDGIFIAYVEHSKIRGIGAMSLDENERLWVANYKGGQINVFKYLQ